MKPVDVGYIDQCDEDYVQALRESRTLSELQRAVDKYRFVAEDAYSIVVSWTPSDFKAFKKWWAEEAKGEFQGEKSAEIWGTVLMPDKLFRVSIVAKQFNTPWGCAYIRMKEEGLI